MKHSFSNKESSFDSSRMIRSSKYNEVREKLDKLKYKFHFDPTNITLIDQMINEINSLRSEVDNLKKDNENLKITNERNNLSVNAFKLENVKLIKENNELIKQNVELGKNIYTSSSSKQMEIKRLQEEKVDFKFMLSSAKLKIDSMAKENSALREKLNSLLSKIYDSNLNENSLRVMFDNDRNLKNLDYLENVESDTRKAIFQPINSDMENLEKSNQQKSNSKGKIVQNRTEILTNKDISELKMGIYVKQRNIHMKNNLDFSNNSLARINENKDYLKKIMIETFGKRQMQDDRNYRDSNTNFNPSSQSNYPNSQIQNSVINNFNYNISNSFDYKKFKENYDKLSNENLMLMNKINTLEKELKEKNKEINRLNYLCRNESAPSNEILIKYLKDEKESLVEKYEKRLEFLINENKKLEETNFNSTKRIKTFNSQYPYISEIENKIDELAHKNKNLMSTVHELEIKLKNGIKENESMNEQLKFHKENCIPKKLVIENEFNYKKLYEDYTANQEIVKRLDEKVRESDANNNSTKSILFSELKEIKAKFQTSSNENKKLCEEIRLFKIDKENLLDKINMLNMNLLRKDNEIRDTSEKMETLQTELETIKTEKREGNSIIEDLKLKIHQMNSEILNKDDEINRLVNLKNMLEKGNSLIKI